MNLAVIPARGGSKRIPKKNIREFCGKPIIAWSIEAAIESGCFDRVIVSTDCAEIADVAKGYGAEVPFVRPEELSDDYVGTSDVVSHAIEYFAGHGFSYDYACCLYATAPFVTGQSLRRGFEQILAHRAAYAFTVTSFPYPIQRALKIQSTQRVEMFYPEYFEARSQDLEGAYHDAGQFYWGKKSAWLQAQPLFSLDSVPVVLPRNQVQDIDTEEDWTLAEALFRNQK